MRLLFLSIVLSIAVPSVGIAAATPACVPGWEPKTCVNSTECAQPEWECCPLKSGDGWQWGDPGCANVE